MRVAELHHNIAELKYKNGLSSPKFLTVHKIECEDELEDCVHKRKKIQIER
jgi:hypothetical protein